jgi:hypothetical protein
MDKKCKECGCDIDLSHESHQDCDPDEVIAICKECFYDILEVADRFGA